MLALDQYIQIGRRAMPDGEPMELRLPEPGKGPVDVRLHRAGDLSPSGNHVYIQPASGDVLMVDRVVDHPIGARFLASISPLHYAQFGGVTVKIVWSVLGLTPLLLFVTGLIYWWRPTNKKKSQSPAVTRVEQRDDECAVSLR
jgi:uncharacterized iron-regulated membrane protein